MRLQPFRLGDAVIYHHGMLDRDLRATVSAVSSRRITITLTEPVPGIARERSMTWAQAANTCRDAFGEQTGDES